MRHVQAGDIWTTELQRQLAAQQIHVFANRTTRDLLAVARSEQILGASPTVTSGEDISASPRAGAGDWSTDWPVVIDGHTYTIRRLRNHNGGARFQLTERARRTAFQAAVAQAGVWFRQVLVSNPTETVDVPLWQQRGRSDTIWAYIVSRGTYPMPQTANVGYRYEFYLPAYNPITAGVLTVGTIGITLDDDRWWIWEAGRWRLLRRPDQIIRRGVRPRVGELTRRIDWNNQPLTLAGDDYTQAINANAMFPEADHPFSVDVSDRPLIAYQNHIVHIIESAAEKTFTLQTDIQLQIAAIGTGQTGDTTRGGNAAGLITRTINARKGDVLKVTGSTGQVLVNDRVLMLPPVARPRQIGGTTAYYAGYRLHLGTEARPYGAGAGGNATRSAPGRAYNLNWIPGTNGANLLLGEGGSAGKTPRLNPGIAGRYPGSGGGQTGTTSSYELEPLIRPRLFYQFDDHSRRASWQVANPPEATDLNAASEFRFMYRTFAEQDPDPTARGDHLNFNQLAGTSGRLGYTAPSPWQSLSAGSTDRPRRAEQRRVLHPSPQPRHRTHPIRTRHPPPHRTRRRRRPRHNRSRVRPRRPRHHHRNVPGGRHRYRNHRRVRMAQPLPRKQRRLVGVDFPPNNQAWLRFTPSDPPSTLVRTLTIAAGTDQVTVEVQASNPNLPSGTPIRTAVWDRPADTGTPPPAATVDAPAAASVNLVYNQTAGWRS